MKYTSIPSIIFLLLTGISAYSQSPGSVNTEILLWLKANSGPLKAGIAALDGDSINVWQDQSGIRINHANSNNATTARPRYRNNSNSNINYNPVVEFNGSTTAMNYGSDYPFVSTGKTGVSYLAVVKPDLTDSKNKQYIYDFGHYATLGYGMFLSDDNAGFYTPNTEAAALRTADDTLAVMMHQDINFNNYRSLSLNGNTTPLVYSTTTPPAVLDGTVINEAATGGAITGPFTIGRQSKISNLTNNNGRYFQGRIAEIVGYSTSLSGTDLQKVQSYLAIKYGITMPVSYLNSTGAVVYDAGSYASDIIGIMRDDASALQQKQSVQPDGLTRLYTSSLAATQSANTGIFSTNLQSLVVGTNGGAFRSFGSTEFPTGQGIYSRLDREWKITNRGFDQTFSMDIFLDADPVNPADLRIMIDDDGDFTNAQIFNPTISFSNGYASIQEISTAMIPQNTTRYMTIISMNINTPLPVEWLSFDVTKTEENHHLLEWKITSGVTSRFEVQRSSNGKDWQSLSTLNQAVTAGYYFYEDENPLAGYNYYRIKHLDIDGTFSYSVIKQLAHQTYVRIYPNPAGSEINIEINESGSADIRIMDIAGHIVKELKHYSEEIHDLKIPLHDLKPGSYILLIEGKAYRIEKI